MTVTVTSRIPVKCIRCGCTHTLIVPERGYDDWRSGALIQHALPSLSDADRELLISRVCGLCFDRMFTRPTPQPGHLANCECDACWGETD